MHGGDAVFIDLGNEPPLTVGDHDQRDSAPVRHAVSLRWLTGTVLTGLTSIGLMGAALVAALDSPGQFASLPEASAAVIDPSIGIVFGRKGDRIRPPEEQVSNRQVMQVSTVTRQGERDFIKLRPFAKINATLAADDRLADQVPAFDPARIFADTDAPEAKDAVPAAPTPIIASADDQIYGANVDSEVAVKVTAFPIGEPDVEPGAALTTAEVEQSVRSALLPALNTPSADDIVGSTMAYADSGVDDFVDDDAFSALGVRIVPENVSSIVKSDGGETAGEPLQERIIPVGKETDLTALFKANDVADDDAVRIVAALTPLVDVAHLRPGQTVRLAFPATESGVPMRPIRASIYQDGAHQATVARSDANAFVRADEPATALSLAAAGDVQPANPSGGLPRIYDAVYQTALEQKMPKPLVDQLIRIFAFDVDLQARITPGDSIEVFHSLPDASNGGEPEILFASLTLNGTTQRFYRFRTTDDGALDYYDEDGRSAKKFLIRKPVPDARITSGFGYRRHPILGTRILHTGVDYAAPRMTPILAAGDGVVEKAGSNSGYGNLIVLRHTNGYETYYGHQTKFAKGIAPGVHVTQGQVIGYVGSTGLSTGPHLHFEIRINGKPVDPLRIRLPRGRVLGADMLTAFEHERTRIDDLLGIEDATPTKVAAAS